MNYELQRAQQDWDNEVEREAADLIKRGIPPFQAMGEAVEVVKQRRNARYLADAARAAQEDQP